MTLLPRSTQRPHRAVRLGRSTDPRAALARRPGARTRIEGCLYCVACGNFTYQPGYGCVSCGYVDPGV